MKKHCIEAEMAYAFGNSMHWIAIQKISGGGFTRVVLYVCIWRCLQFKWDYLSKDRKVCIGLNGERTLL